MDVSILSSDEQPAWDEFVTCCPAAVPFHLSGWQHIMGSVYGFQSWYLVAREAGRIEGVLPLFRVGGLLTGRALTSLPGGLCTQNPQAAGALLDRAREIARSSSSRRLLIRDSHDAWGDPHAWRADHSAPIRELPPDAETLRKQLSRQIRQHLRKAQEAGVETAAGPEYLDDFFQVFSELLHEKGVPVFGRRFLRAVADDLGDRMAVVVARHEGRPVGAILHFGIGDTLFAVWGGSPARYRDLRAPHALWWGSMVYGIDHGYRLLDMGRSTRGSGAEEFKLRWGGASRPVYQLVAPAVRPGLNGQVNSKGVPYRAFTGAWRRLPPGVARALGPRLRRYVPFG